MANPWYTPVDNVQQCYEKCLICLSHPAYLQYIVCFHIDNSVLQLKFLYYVN